MKQKMGALFYILMLPFGFVSILCCVGVVSLLVPNLPDSVYFGLLILGLFFLCSWMVQGIVKTQLAAYKPSVELNHFLQTQGFTAKQKVGVSRYLKAVETGVNEIYVKKGPTQSSVEIMSISRSEAFFSIGKGPLLLSPFLQKQSLPPELKKHFQTLELKALKGQEHLGAPRWQSLLNYLNQQPAAIYTQQGKKTVLREGNYQSIEQFKALYAIINSLSFYID